MENDISIEALEKELSFYEARGEKDRAAEVAAEIKRRTPAEPKQVAAAPGPETATAAAPETAVKPKARSRRARGKA